MIQQRARSYGRGFSVPSTAVVTPGTVETTVDRGPSPKGLASLLGGTSRRRKPAAIPTLGGPTTFRTPFALRYRSRTCT